MEVFTVLEGSTGNLRHSWVCSWLSHSLAVCPWANHQTFLSFGLLICRMGMMVYLKSLF